MSSTTRSAPSRRPEWRRARVRCAGASETDGFSGGWPAACLVSAGRLGLRHGGFGRAAGSVRLASITFGFAPAAARAGGGVGAAAEADLAGEAGEEAVRLRVRRRIGDPRRSRRPESAGRSELRFFRRAEQQIVGGRPRGGLTWEGMVPGARDSASSDRPWPSPPSDSRYCRRARVAANTLFMPPSMPVLIRATGVPLAISLAVSACIVAAAFRARRRRFRRGSHRPGIWPTHRTPDRAWRSAP